MIYSTLPPVACCFQSNSASNSEAICCPEFSGVAVALQHPDVSICIPVDMYTDFLVTGLAALIRQPAVSISGPVNTRLVVPGLATPKELDRM